MAATYNKSLPTALDRVRHLLGDTNVVPETAALRSDETYNALITRLGETGAVIEAAQGLATEYAQQPDSVSLAGDAFTWKDRVKTWQGLADRLKAAVAANAQATAYGPTRVARTYRPEDQHNGEYRRPEGLQWPAL